MSRSPRQQRAQHKVELILESAMRLLEKGGMAALTTNAVAEKAGVSIGTLYQYFGNKEAILDALADREMGELSARVVTVIEERGEIAPADRVARIIRAVTASYGGRPQVHRLVMEHSLARGGKRLQPMIERLVALVAATGRFDADGRLTPISHAEAFVLTSAFAGVMRAMVLTDGDALPPQAGIEAALIRLITDFAARG